jgi:CRP-like cAMP-binding protein
MKDFSKILRSHEEAIEKARLTFLRTIPEFAHMGNNVMKRLCYEFQKIDCIKNHVLYREGEESKYVYFVLSGRFVVHKVLKTIKEEIVVEEPGQIIESLKKNEDARRKKILMDMKQENYILGQVQEGHILGLEEAVLPPQTKPYKHTIVCDSMKAELYRVEKSSFIAKLTSQAGPWADLHSKALASIKRTTANLRNKASIANKLKKRLKEAEDHNAGGAANRAMTACKVLRNDDTSRIGSAGCFGNSTISS